MDLLVSSKKTAANQVRRTEQLNPLESRSLKNAGVYELIRWKLNEIDENGIDFLVENRSGRSMGWFSPDH